jgi:hypothetical protein
VIIRVEDDGDYQVPDAEGDRIRQLAESPRDSTESSFASLAEAVRAVGVRYDGPAGPDLVLTAEDEVLTNPGVWDDGRWSVHDEHWPSDENPEHEHDAHAEPGHTDRYEWAGPAGHEAAAYPDTYDRGVEDTDHRYG